MLLDYERSKKQKQNTCWYLDTCKNVTFKKKTLSHTRQLTMSNMKAIACGDEPTVALGFMEHLTSFNTLFSFYSLKLLWFTLNKIALPASCCRALQFTVVFVCPTTFEPLKMGRSCIKMSVILSWLEELYQSECWQLAESSRHSSVLGE